MRKLTEGNKRSFATFVIVVVIIIAILVICLLNVLSNQEPVYEIDSNTFLYDINNNPIEVLEQGKIDKKWDGNYYLSHLNQGQEEEYELGAQVVAYNPNRIKLDLFGTEFQVSLDGTVQKLTRRQEVTNLSEDKFYKLADRKYLIVGSNITNEANTLATSNYLIVILDKAGNASFLNHEINSKTLKPMVIRTSSFSFDIANEKLIVNDNEIDLKKIIGSTNEYKEVELADNGEQNTQENINSTSIAGQSTVQQNSDSTVNNQDTTIVNGNVNLGTSTGSGSSGTTGGSDGNKTPLSKSVSLRNVSQTSSYIDVEYNVIDPENKYQTVYLLVDGNVQKNISLDKSAKTYRITGLTPNSQYTLTLGYREISDDGNIEDKIEDVLVVRTNRVNVNLAITKVTNDKIYFNLKTDSNYSFDSGNLVLYINGERRDSIAIDTTSASSNSGWSSSINYSKSGAGEVVLRLENVTHDGQSVTTDIQVKFRN